MCDRRLDWTEDWETDMNTLDVIMVRIYLHEGQGQMKSLMHLLHDEEKVRGVTAFRGVSGFGQSGKMHSSTLLDMSLDLPLIIEFFDEPEKVDKVLEHLNELVKPGHMVSWPAKINVGE
jgi:PII-like signaling protein